MKDILNWVLDLLQTLFGDIRDRERNVEVQEHINKASEEADEIIKNSSTADRDAVLERLHRNHNRNS